MSEIETRQLSCGMTLLAQPMGGVRSAALSWLVPAGTATEPADRLGIAGIWSEMLLRGAGARSSREHADACDRLGANRNAEAGNRFLRVGSSLVGTNLNEALPLLTDLVLAPRFEAESLIAAKDLSLQALASLVDDPHERAVLAARKRHRPSPFNRSDYGTEEGINAITIEDVKKGWRERARPGGSVIGIAGEFSVDSVQNRLDELLSDWKGTTSEPTKLADPPRGYAHEEDTTNQVQIVLVHDAPAEPHADSMLERVVTSVLSGGMSGRLFTEVREKRGLCYSVHASYSADRDDGRVGAYVGTTPERAQESLDVLTSELHRISTQEGQITEDEFERAIIGMKSRIVFSGESTSARAGALVGDWVRLGRARTLDELTAAIDAITLEQVRDYASRRSLGTVTIQTLGPEALTPPAIPAAGVSEPAQ